MCRETRNMVAVGGTTTYMWAFMLVEYTGRRPYYIQCSMDRSLKPAQLIQLLGHPPQIGVIVYSFFMLVYTLSETSVLANRTPPSCQWKESGYKGNYINEPTSDTK